MRRLLLPILILLFLGGCATRYGKLEDGRGYSQYDIQFNKDKGKFVVPLDGKEETVETKSE